MGVDIVRDTAVEVLVRVFYKGAYLNHALDSALQRRAISGRGRRFLTQLVYGTVRHKLLCDFVLNKFLNQPLDKLPPHIHVILQMGVFQALFLSQVTFPAMVHTSVDLARHHGHAGVARLTNAVLRRVPQSIEEIHLPGRSHNLPLFLSIRYSFPEWLVRRWLAEYGEEKTETLLAASNTEAPVTLRANTLRTTAEDLIEVLKQRECEAVKGSVVPEEVTLLSGPPPVQLKLFQEGGFMVQDAASMLPPHVLEPEPGMRVLDMCAAPGSKTTHLGQLTGDQARVFAMDVHPAKLRFVVENAERLGLSSVVPLCGDGVHAPFGAETFDRVLVDAPCSGLGTLRRHPDLKWHTAPDVFDRLHAQQVALLRSAIQLCKMGGLIVYSVCTFTNEETRDVGRAVMDTEPVCLENGPEWLGQWNENPGQYRILPTDAGLDGFFLMRLRKVS